MLYYVEGVAQLLVAGKSHRVVNTTIVKTH